MATESPIEKSFIAWCKKFTLWTLKLRPQTEGKGWPDRAVLLPNNRIGWIEFKSPTGDLSPHQVEMIKRLEASGHKVGVCRSSSEAQTYLRELKNEI